MFLRPEPSSNQVSIGLLLPLNLIAKMGSASSTTCPFSTQISGFFNSPNGDEFVIGPFDEPASGWMNYYMVLGAIGGDATPAVLSALTRSRARRNLALRRGQQISERFCSARDSVTRRPEVMVSGGEPPLPGAVGGNASALNCANIHIMENPLFDVKAFKVLPGKISISCRRLL